MIRRFGTQEELLRQADIALKNLRTRPELQGPMGERGFGQALVERMYTRLQSVTSTIGDYNREASEKVAASKARMAARDALIEVLGPDRDLLKIRYRREPARRALLALDERDAVTYAGVRRQARTLYDTIMGDAQLQAEAAERGLTQEVLVQRLALVIRFEQADADYSAESAQAHDARQRRDEEIDAFASDLADLLDSAEAILAARPKLLQMLYEA
jgi:hypothetical protein